MNLHRMDFKDMALACVLLASRPHNWFRVISRRAMADARQLQFNGLAQVTWNRDEDVAWFCLTPLGQDIARDFPEMAEV